MGEWIFTTLLIELTGALTDAVEHGIEYFIRKTVDHLGRTITQFGHHVDSDGDGVYDSEQILYTLEITIPDLSNGYCLVSDGDTVGIGMPMFQLIDGIDITNYVDTLDPFNLPVLTANGNGYLLDADSDGDEDDVIISFADLTGDGMPDFGLLVDNDDNGIPDASDAAPYYEVGSPEYKQILAQSSNVPSIIVMSPDGTMSVYDTTGQLTSEDCDTAYSLWMSDNGIMTKPLDNYTVTEGLLLIAGTVACFGFVSKLFRRRKVM